MSPSPSEHVPPAPVPRAAEGDDISLLAVGHLVLRHRLLVFGLGVAAALLVVAVTLLRPRTYTSATTFMPQTSSNSSLSRMSGLATQLGINIPTADPGSSPAFYANLLKSDAVLRQVVTTPFDVGAGGRPTRESLVGIFRARGRTPAQRRDAAVKRLLKQMSVSTGRETGLVNLEVTTTSAALSQQVSQRMIELVSEFNLQRRQTNAGAERRFIEGRVREAHDSLRRSEDRLQLFLQRNRDFRNAPSLAFEHDRLQRVLQLQQEVYSSLVQSYEQARIDEVRNTPVLTIVGPPDLPSLPDPRWALIKGALGLVVGLLLGAFIAAVVEMSAPLVRRARRTTPPVRADAAADRVRGPIAPAAGG